MTRNSLSRKAAQKGVRAVRALAMGASPRVRRKIKAVVIAQLGLDRESNLRGSYARWLENHYPDAIALYESKQAAAKFTYQPLISILTPVYANDTEHLVECIRSVQSQIYQNWEMCIVDDASPNEAVRAQIKAFAAEDPRIRYKFQKKNGHISAATNVALGIAQGEFIGLLDHDDILWPNALYEVVRALNQNRKLDFIYSDEEKVHYNRQDHQNPFFKPDWNPEFLQCVNYITHFAVLRRSLVQDIGGFRSAYDGAQDWDLFLRATNATKRIHHIPTVLYSWRMSETSTALNTDAKPYVVDAQKTALEASLKARGLDGVVKRGGAKDYWTVEYPVQGRPLVSIIIPCKNLYKVLKTCVDSIYAKTTYDNFEVIVVDTGSTEDNVRRWYRRAQRQHSNFRVIDWPEQPFSYARSCNAGAVEAKGKYLVMLNSDIEVITPNWIELLLGDAQQPDVGPVGCLLYYPDGELIQHAGIGIGFGGVAANSLSQVNINTMQPMQHLYAKTRHEVSAVTAACMMVKKDRFNKVKGFDEKFRVTYNDVDLCLRLNDVGYRSIYNPAVEMLHYESLQLGRPEEKAKRDTAEFDRAKRLFKKRWAAVIAHDPHLNLNISRDNALFEIDTKLAATE